MLVPSRPTPFRKSCARTSRPINCTIGAQEADQVGEHAAVAPQSGDLSRGGSKAGKAVGHEPMSKQLIDDELSMFPGGTEVRMADT